MKKDIDLLYTNDIGIVFKWKITSQKDKNKVQLVFRDTGFYIQPKELFQFSKCIKKAIKNSGKCSSCVAAEGCRSILIETPIKELTFAVNRTELYLLNELILGSLFQLNLNSILTNMNINEM